MAKLLISNRFEINDLEKDLLGRGGMGVVYRAIDNQTGETVAVKALNPDVLARDPGMLERFKREGQALRQLNHPNIVRMITTIEENDQHYLAMEYVPGGSLQDTLSAKGRIIPDNAIQIALDLADALTRAHRLGITHRDLKPANVLIAQDGTPRLTDFGIAYSADTPHLTQTGVLVGTVDYLSPEACQGEQLDERSDVWSFGVLLFQMLSGSLPFKGGSLTTKLTAILTQPTPDLKLSVPDIPDGLVSLVQRMLEKDPEQRIHSVRLVGAELEDMLNGRAPLTPSGASQPEKRFATPTPLTLRAAKPELPSGTVTFLFTDIEASTKHAREHPESWESLHARHDEILRAAVAQNNGHVFQVIGDAVCAAFHNAGAAIRAAIDAQRNLQAEDWGGTPVRVRMGIHTGAAEWNESVYQGYSTLALVQRVMSAGHGGQILLSQAAHDLTRDWLPNQAGLIDLGERNLKDIPRPERLYQLCVPDLPGDFPALKTFDKTRNNLPIQLSTFIGREKETGQIRQRLEKNRLVTLTGSGGIGKTRLSIQVAAELLPQFPIGVWLVELAPLVDPSLVPQTVCAALGVKPASNTSAQDALINYLRARKVLLVLDNCEHLIDACAELCDALLHACPDLRIIASSREALGIEGENAYRVPSLSLPGSKSGLQVIENSEAVRLFIERASAVLPGFEITPANAPLIAQICQRLDGIALAIELAASRIKMLKLEQISTRLDDAFRLLTGGSRTALPRQQTLRALIDWSYNLLSDDERAFLRRLSVFMGGWSLEAAEVICANAEALDLLTRLADKSLVAVDYEHGPEARYYLLETIRQYAREKLAETGEVSDLRDAHLGYFLQQAERIGPELNTRKSPYWLEYLEIEYPNFHATLEWAQERDSEAGLRMSNMLYPFWFNFRSYRKEALEWFEIFLRASPAKRNATRAWALFNFINLQDPAARVDLLKSSQSLDECLALAREIGDHACTARALGLFAFSEINTSFDAAQSFAEQGLVEARLSGNERIIGLAIYLLGDVAFARSGTETARKLVEDSLVYTRKAGDLQHLSLAVNMLGLISIDRGEWDSAEKYFQEALSLAEEGHDRYFFSCYVINLGSLFTGMGHFDRATSYFQQARNLVQDTPDDFFLNGALLGLGEIARFQGDVDQAAALLGEALALAKMPPNKGNIVCHLANVERMRGEIAQARQHMLAGIQLIMSEFDWNQVTLEVIPLVAYFALDQHMTRQAVCLLGWLEAWCKTKDHVNLPIYQAELEGYLSQAREQLSEAEFKAAWAEGGSMNQEQAQALALEILA